VDVNKTWPRIVSEKVFSHYADDRLKICNGSASELLHPWCPEIGYLNLEDVYRDHWDNYRINGLVLSEMTVYDLERALIPRKLAIYAVRNYTDATRLTTTRTWTTVWSVKTQLQA